MKKLFSSIWLMFLGILVLTAQESQESTLFITYDGCKTTFRQSLKVDELSSLRNRMESLIKSGCIPLVIESENDVVWVYLNDPIGAKDYPEADFESDYFEVIKDLFPLKLTSKLKKSLKKGNRAFMKTLGVKYVIEDEEVISKINYNVFEKFAF